MTDKLYRTSEMWKVVSVLEILNTMFYANEYSWYANIDEWMSEFGTKEHREVVEEE